MTLVLAVVGLLASIYAILPHERQLELRVRLSVVDLLLASIAFVLILYCEYYSFVYSHPIRGVRLAWPLDKWPKELKPSDVSDLVIIVWAALTALHMRFRRLSRWNIDLFRRLLDELLWAGGYQEIFNIIGRYRKPLFRLHRSDYWTARLRDWFEAAYWPKFRFDSTLAELLQATEQVAPVKHPAKALPSRPFAKRALKSIQVNLRWCRHLLPDDRNSKETAEIIIRSIFLSDSVVSQLVRLRPYLGISVLELWRRDHNRSEFVQMYLWKLIEEPSSVFYTELRNNQNLISGGRYYLPPTNQLLSFFLSDARVAKENGAYKPIGDFALMLLDEVGQDPKTDPYNRALGYYREHEAWRSPLYAVIRFFDIMVEEALHQDITWHMWLYYFPSIVESMARNYRLIDPFSNPIDEWPNRYSYLIYEIFSSLKTWIRDAADLGAIQANTELEHIDSRHENGNIPKSSIKALCECLYHVAVSKNLPQREKHSLTNGTFELYFDLRMRDRFRDYSTVLLCCLRDVGRGKSQGTDYFDVLRQVFSSEEMEFQITQNDEHVVELEKFLNEL